MILLFNSAHRVPDLYIPLNLWPYLIHWHFRTLRYTVNRFFESIGHVDKVLNQQALVEISSKFQLFQKAGCHLLYSGERVYASQNNPLTEVC